MEASFAIAALIVGLYAWSYFAPAAGLVSKPLVSSIALALALATLAISLVLYIWIPKKHMLLAALAVYLALAATAAWLVIETGGANSPFIALWMLVAAFAGVFGWYMVGSMGLLVFGYIAVTIASDGHLTSGDNLLAMLFGGLMPLGMGMLIWHRQPTINRGSIDLDRPDNSALYKMAGQSESLINAIGDGILAIDSHNIVQLINPAAQRLIGWTGKDAVSLDYRSVMQLGTLDGQELQPSLDPILQALNTNQQHQTNDLSLQTKSGKRLFVSMVVSPVGDPGAGVIVAFRDITKEKTEEREQAEFISTASHEMRTPVASIEGYLGLALNPATAQVDSNARMYLEKARESTQHLGRLFQNLLDISRAEDGRLTSNPSLIDVVSLTRDITASLKPQADAKSLALIFKPDSQNSSEKQLHPMYHIKQDRDHFREIISNLIENAIKYTSQGEIVVNVTGDDDQVKIAIKDSGIGIPSEDIPHLFQKFYRVDNSDTREIGGTGLGLYLSRRLVESMNGRIWVDSKHRRGSTFFVSLPRVTQAELNSLQDSTSQNEPSPQVSPIAQPAPSVQPVATAPPTLSEIEKNPNLHKRPPLANRQTSHPRQSVQPTRPPH